MPYEMKKRKLINSVPNEENKINKCGTKAEKVR